MKHSFSGWALLGLVPFLILAGGCAQSGEPEFGYVAAQGTGDLSLGRVARTAFDAELTETCGPGGLTGAGAASILRAPYVQRVQAQSASLLWTSRSDAGGFVVVSAGDRATTVVAQVDAAASTPANWQYHAALTGLEPDTIYCYEVRGADDEVLGSAGFRTAPRAGSPEPVRFVAVGDSGIRSPDQAAVLAAMQTVPFDLVLHAGDLAYREGTLEQHEENFFEPYGKIIDRIPLFPAIGNHEYRTAEGAPFRQVFATFENGGPESRGLWYSFDWGDLHIVILDAMRIIPEQAAWLEADLTASRAPWTIVLLHRSPYSSGQHGGDPQQVETMVPIFEAHGVDLVFAGHDHSYERTNPLNGVTYIVTGGGGQGTRDVGTSDFTAFSERVAHFVHGEVTGDELQLRAIDATGAEFDGVRLQRGR